MTLTSINKNPNNTFLILFIYFCFYLFIYRVVSCCFLWSGADWSLLLCRLTLNRTTCDTKCAIDICLIWFNSIEVIFSHVQFGVWCFLRDDVNCFAKFTAAKFVVIDHHKCACANVWCDQMYQDDVLIRCGLFSITGGYEHISYYEIWSWWPSCHDPTIYLQHIACSYIYEYTLNWNWKCLPFRLWHGWCIEALFFFVAVVLHSYMYGVQHTSGPRLFDHLQLFYFFIFFRLCQSKLIWSSHRIMSSFDLCSIA